jgi:autotransporter-associated beta strand protein
MKLRTHSLEVLETRIAPATFHWALSGDGTWNSPASWFNESTGVVGDGFPNAVDDVAKFTSASVPTAIVTIDGVNITVGSIVFDAANEFYVTGINGGALTLSSSTVATIKISAVNGSSVHEIRTPVTLASPLVLDHDIDKPFYFRDGSFNDNGFGLSKIGIGLVQTAFDGPGSITGPIHVGGGTLFLGGLNTLVTGPLTIGGEGTSAEFVTASKIDPTISISVLADGKLNDRAGVSRIGHLLIDGGEVQLNSVFPPSRFHVASLTMTGGSIASARLGMGPILVVDGGIIATSDENGPATIATRMQFLSAPQIFTVTDGPQDVDLLFNAFTFSSQSSGGLTKEGKGTMRIAGLAASSLVITGPTTVKDGVLELASNPDGLAEISGPLIIGDGAGRPGSAVVRVFDANQIKTGIAVTITNDGLLDLNGNSATLAALTMNGGKVTTGAAAADLIITNSATFNAAHLSAQAVGSRIFLPPNPIVPAGATGQSRIVGLGSVEMANGESLLFTVNDTPHNIDLRIDVPIRGSASAVVQKDGGGTLALDRINDYGGTTTVFAGGLRVNGKIGDLVLVNGDGTRGSQLTGTGTIGAITSPDGAYRISPAGTGTGTLHTGSLSSMTADRFVYDLSGKRPGQNDSIAVNGTVDLTGAGALNVRLHYVPKRGHTFTLIDNDGTDPVVGQFAGADDGALIWIDHHRFRISYTGGDGNDVTLTAKPPIPHAIGKAKNHPIPKGKIPAAHNFFGGTLTIETNWNFVIHTPGFPAIDPLPTLEGAILSDALIAAIESRLSAL